MRPGAAWRRLAVANKAVDHRVDFSAVTEKLAPSSPPTDEMSKRWALEHHAVRNGEHRHQPRVKLSQVRVWLTEYDLENDRQRQRTNVRVQRNGRI